jgi:hypothetical protein
LGFCPFPRKQQCEGGYRHNEITPRKN